MGDSSIAILLPSALFIIMLGMGLALKPEDFLRVFSQPSKVLLGLGLQLLLLPVLGVLVVMMLDLPPILAAGLMILTFAPGGATSNMISYLCRGDTALSISLTTVTSLIIPLTLPTLTFIALEFLLGQGTAIDFPITSTVAKLLMVSIVPVCIGVALNLRWPQYCRRLQSAVKWLSLLFMLAVVIVITVANYEMMPVLLPQLAPAVLLLAISAMLLGYLIPRYIFSQSNKRSLTYSVETGIQNAGTALMVTGAILQNSEMSMSVLMYGILMQIPALLLIAYRNLQPVRRLAET